VFLLIGLCGALVTLANSAPKVEKLRDAYSLDEKVNECDGKLMRRKLLKLLSRREVKLFLSVIKLAEAGEPDLMVGGCHAHSLEKHSALLLPEWCRYPVKGWGHSTASGNYQLTLSNWKMIAPFLGLRDFSEINQALAALELIRRGGGAAGAYTVKGLALKQRIQGGFLRLLQGNVDSALCMATADWASSSCSTLPANNKIVYARLADKIRKSEANRPRRGEVSGRLHEAYEKVKAPSRSSGRAIKASCSRTKVPKPGYTAARGKS
jgi:muramidase (phage lysozyme)